MKVLHAGNLVNVGYLTTKQLRKNNIDAELLLDPLGSDPTKLDPDLKNGYPDWCIQYQRNKPFWKLKILKTMRKKKYDLIHAYVELPIFAYLSGKKFIVQALGSDFREMAISNSLRGIFLRRAYKKAKVILFSMPDHIPIYTKLGLKNGIFFPLLVDTTFFKPKKVERGELVNKFLVLHATNLDWKLKGNDKLLNAFAKFVKTNPNSILIIIERGIDSQRTHDLVNSLKINDNVKFVKGPLNSIELQHYFNLVDVIAESFIFPAMSGITNESLCCEKPVITYYPKNDFEGVYIEHPPVLNASNAEEIYEHLETLKDENKRKNIGKKGREWISQYNDPAFYCTKLKVIYESVLKGNNIEKIRKNLSDISMTRNIH